MDVPSMVQRSGDTLIVRSVVSGNQLYLDQQTGNIIKPPLLPLISTAGHHHQQQNLLPTSIEQLERLQQFGLSIEGRNNNNNTITNNTININNNTINNNNSTADDLELDNSQIEPKDEGLPQCKIKRNYSCSTCTFFTQNPRYFLTHLRDVHGEKIVINECKLCLYASRHYQKLVRHMKMVHGSTEGIEDHAQARKRQLGRESRKRKIESPIVVQQQQQQQQQQQPQLQQQYIQPIQQNVQQTIQQQTPFYQHQQQQQQQIQQQQHSKEGFIDITSSAEDGSGKNRLLKCSLCDYTTLYRAQLVEHETDEHCKTKFFRCEKCSYVTHIKARFSKHVKYHSMPMIKCVTCDFRTPYKWNLDRHMKNHGGSGPFKCAACNFTADIKQSLTVHEMNHHVPPVGHAAGMSLTRRRNKVGGTDLSDNEDLISDSGDFDDILNNYYKNINNNNNNINNNNNNNVDDLDDGVVVQKKPKYNDNDQPTDLSQKSGPDSIKISISKGINNNNNRRPIPNLIPIQSSSIPATNNSNLATSLQQQSKLFYQATQNLQRDEVTTNRLREIAEMIFGSGVFPENIIPMMPQFSPTSSISNNSSSGGGGGGGVGGGAISITGSHTKKKSSNFFDKLKERFSGASGDCNTDNENLICGGCGHISKCLSELILHRKSCKKISEQLNEKHSSSSPSPINLSINSTGSTRCQYCRHRCKSSTDLINHLKNCQEASNCQNDSFDSLSDSIERNDDEEDDIMIENGVGKSILIGGKQQQQHPMENRVFVWNQIPEVVEKRSSAGAVSGGILDNSGFAEHNGQLSSTPPEKMQIDDNQGIEKTSPTAIDVKNEENSYYGVETAPGYGEVTKKMTPEEEAANSSLKKVYKCPHCSFWASTASRFHVHIVGHLNKKPFECSLCNYRSNWRWDITKHIRLKTIRDPSHKNARVLMNDETGRRNYTKYNKYITLMKVTEEDGDPKLMKSGEMTPNQEATLAFLKDYDSKMISNNNSGGSNDESNSGGGGGSRQIEMIRQSIKDEPRQQSDDSRFGGKMQLFNSSLSIKDMNGNISSGTGKRSPPGLIKTGGGINGENDSLEKNKLYRCKECNYKHSNRDMLVAHVKQHTIPAAYNFTQQQQQKQQQQQQFFQKSIQNLGIPLEIAVNSTYGNYVNELLTAMYFHHQQQQQHQQQNGGNQNLDKDFLQQVQNAIQFGGTNNNNNNNNNNLPINLIPTLIQGQKLNLPTGGINSAITAGGAAAATAAAATAGGGILLGPFPSTLIGGKKEHGEIDEASSTTVGVVTTTTTTTSCTANTNTTTTTTALVNGTSGNTTNPIITSGGTTTTTTTILPSSGGLINNNSGGSNHDNNNDSQWRGPAPYRCGHCHQVSNWKHVIQRHCRLKHNGDIRIETVDRTSDRHAPIYRPLGTNQQTGGRSSSSHHNQHQQQQNHHNQNINNNVLSRNHIETSNNCINTDLISVNINDSKRPLVEIEKPLKSNNDHHSNNNNINNNITTADNTAIDNSIYVSNNTSSNNSSNSVLSTKSKQQQCTACNYVSESKSQMNYHISLHKANQYECNTCGFLCSKKQELNIHIKNIHEYDDTSIIGQTVSASAAISLVKSGCNNPTPITTSTSSTTLISAASGAACTTDNEHDILLDDEEDEEGRLVIDLALSENSSIDQQQQQQRIQQQNSDKFISFCQNCPARFLSKHDLFIHQKYHQIPTLSLLNYKLYNCDLCTFIAKQEPLLLSHLIVHQQEYYDKTILLCQKYQIDNEYLKPKLLKTNNNLWIILNDEHDKCENNNNNELINNSNNKCKLQQENSLLKKQLETNLNNKSLLENVQSITIDDDDNNNNNCNNNNNNLFLEKCPYCPFETRKTQFYKIHLKCHFIVSKYKDKFNCDHCDYSINDENILNEHIKCHFQIYENCKSVAFYTSYDNLELNLINNSKINNNNSLLSPTISPTPITTNTENDIVDDDNNNNNNDTIKNLTKNINKKLLYKSDNNNLSNLNNNNENINNNLIDGHNSRKIVDFSTGQILNIEPIKKEYI